MDDSDVHGCSNSWEDGIFSRWSIESFKFFSFDFCNSNKFFTHKDPHEWIPACKEFLVTKRDELRSMKLKKSNSIWAILTLKHLEHNFID
jgi:hypothetical protein